MGGYAQREADQALWQAATVRRRVREAIDRRDLNEARRLSAEAHRLAGKAQIFDQLAKLDHLSSVASSIGGEAEGVVRAAQIHLGARTGQEDPGAQVS